MMPSLFISYRRVDSGGHAGRLFDRLRSWYSKDELFFDVSTIDWGEDFPEKIDRAIRSAKAVLVVIGPGWLEILNERAGRSGVDFVRRELTIAIQRRVANEVKVLPILVGGAQMPSITSLHADLRDKIGRLLNYQAREFPADDVGLWDCQFDHLRQRLSRVKGVPPPCAQWALAEGSPTRSFDKFEPTRRPNSLDAQAVEQAFGVVSTALLNWPQMTDGHWIERPELDQLYERVTRHDSAITVLLAGPGEGKSALLSRLSARLSGADVVLLAIKADTIPRKTATLSELNQWIDCGTPTTQALLQLAEDRRVVVLIDQLDALSELMDQHSERLSVLITLINAIRAVPNLHVLVSCREFEFRNDVRFKALDAEEVSLARLSWDQVEPILAARGFETNGWSGDVREVLRTPQHLAMFLDYLADKENVPLFNNYQGLLARIVAERLQEAHGTRTVEAAERIAADMALEEELWVGRGRFEQEFGVEIQRLEEAGFLVRSDNGLSISFRHQTLFDFLRARTFLRDQESLADYIVDQKQQSLFVRPILWNALNYLRASDKAVYRRQFGDLWTRPDLRPHVRRLLVDFLGRITDPDDQEVHWLFPKLHESVLRPKILRAIAGSRGWFARLESRLPSLMTTEPDIALEVVATLGRAASFDPNLVLRAVDQHWVTDKRYLQCALAVMRNFTAWDESSVDVVCKLADYAPEDAFVIQYIAKQISKSSPNLAPKVPVRYLRARTKRIDTHRVALLSQLAPDVSITAKLGSALRVGDQLNAYERLIDNSTDWYSIDEVARRAPRAFVEEIWPWLGELFIRLGREERPLFNQYRRHHGLAFMRETSEKQPLQVAIERAIRDLAETEVEYFLKFLHKNKSTDLMVLHRLLALGLEKIAREHPATVLQYLLEDPRRFAIGNINNEHCDSQTLILAIVPSLTNDEAFGLEKAITELMWYRSAAEGEDAGLRLEQQKWTRERRLRLLRAFPFERLSKSGQKHIREEERAFPGVRAEHKVVRAGYVGSPMSAKQMEKATDDEILRLFEELTDEVAWDHPKRSHDFVGGSIQASREFAGFARNAPHRALNLIRRFQAGKTERPAGAALVEMAKVLPTADELVTCVHELDEREFASEHFRTDSARCMKELARRFGGLGDQTCGLLEKWITNWQPETDPATTEGKGGHSRTAVESNVPGEHYQESLLWDHRSPQIVPAGNYPVLEALMWGYLRRTPPLVNNWLAVLERHLAREENPAVWCEVSVDLWRLREADRARAARFLESLFSTCPEVFLNASGVSLIAHVLTWLPAELLDRVIDAWISGSWQGGPQAAGEILALTHCRKPDDANTRVRIERIMAGDDHDQRTVEELRLGVTHTLVAAWSEPTLRAMATSLLVRVASLGGTAVEQALSAIFRKAEPLPADDHTRALLETLLKRPSILTKEIHFLIKGLKGLLCDGWNANLVYQIVDAVMLEEAGDLGDIGTMFAANVGGLSDIVLTLHRIPETREVGLNLFERLMDMDSYELDERIAIFDRPPFE